MQCIKGWRDLAEYCEGQPHVLIIKGGCGYVIWTANEIVDMASIKPIDLSIVVQIYRKLVKFFGNRIVYADLRKTTSYKLFHWLVQKERVHVIKDEPYEWCGETFHEVRFTFKN